MEISAESTRFQVRAEKRKRGSVDTKESNLRENVNAEVSALPGTASRRLCSTIYNFDAQRCPAKRSRRFSVFRSQLSTVRRPRPRNSLATAVRSSTNNILLLANVRVSCAPILFATFRTRAVAKITSLQKDTAFYRDQRQNKGSNSRSLRAPDTVGERSRGSASLNNRTKNLVRFNSAMLKRPSRTPVPISIFTRHPCNF